jgi:hypothetical protein
VVDARNLSPKPDCRFRVRRPGSTRHKELTNPKYAAFGDCWCRGRIWNDLCCDAGPDCNAQAPVKRGHEPKNGSNHGRVSGPLGLLRFIDSFATSGALEHHRGVGQFAERRRVLVLCPRRKTSASESVKRIPIGRSLSSIGRILGRVFLALSLMRFYVPNCVGYSILTHEAIIDAFPKPGWGPKTEVGPGKQRSRQCEVLLHISECAT